MGVCQLMALPGEAGPPHSVDLFLASIAFCHIQPSALLGSVQPDREMQPMGNGHTRK